jgi:hypothetical protein
LACDLRNKLVKAEEMKHPLALVEKDFDDLVIVWDR